MKVWRGGNIALEVPVHADEDVGVGSLTQRAVDGASELFIGLVRAGVEKL
jgi:D-alanyl-D-alanine carboxypeptidase (penicillin-binding protein 5/6)